MVKPWIGVVFTVNEYAGIGGDPVGVKVAYMLHTVCSVPSRVIVFGKVPS